MAMAMLPTPIGRIDRARTIMGRPALRRLVTSTSSRPARPRRRSSTAPSCVGVGVAAGPPAPTPPRPRGDAFPGSRTRFLHALSASRQPAFVRRRQIRWSGRTAGGGGGGGAGEAERRREDHKHCVEMVQARDVEGYLCGLLVPPAAREGYFALRAFNAEVAGIKDSSSRSRGGGAGGGGEGGFDGGDPSLASRLRMRWWGDAVAKMYEGEGAIAGERNPTLRSLARAVREHDLTRRFLDRMVEAREADLDVARYDGMGDVARYGEDTASSLLYLSLECAGVRDENADAVASDVGVALGILTALRSTAFRAARGESSIPDDVALRHSASMDALRSALEASARGDGTDEQREPASREAVRSASREMAAAASVRLARARENQHLVPKEGRTAILLPAACGLRCLDSLKEVDYDVFHPSVVGDGGRRLGLMFLLGRTWLTGIF